MTEVIGKVISTNLETVLQTTCRDILIPAFSRGFQNVLCQVNETFQKGLNTCEFVYCLSRTCHSEFAKKFIMNKYFHEIVIRQSGKY